MKLSIGDFLVPAILLGALGWWGYGNWSDRAEKAAREKARVEALAHDEQALADLGRRFQATRALTGKLADLGPRVLTYQVQNALQVPAGKAVVISGSLVDLALSDGQYALLLEDRVADGLVLRYLLRCDAAVAGQVIAKRAGAGVISVVARFSAVEGDGFRPADGGSKPSGAADPAGPTRFLARGQCLDAVVR